MELSGFISKVQSLLPWPPPSCSSPGALDPSTFAGQRLSSDSPQRRLCEAKPRLTLSSVAAVQSSPAQAIPVPPHAAGRRGVQCCTAESGGERSAGGGGEDEGTGSHV